MNRDNRTEAPTMGGAPLSPIARAHRLLVEAGFAFESFDGESSFSAEIEVGPDATEGNSRSWVRVDARLTGLDAHPDSTACRRSDFMVSRVSVSNDRFVMATTRALSPIPVVSVPVKRWRFKRDGDAALARLLAAIAALSEGLSVDDVRFLAWARAEDGVWKWRYDTNSPQIVVSRRSGTSQNMSAPALWLATTDRFDRLLAAGYLNYVSGDSVMCRPIELAMSPEGFDAWAWSLVDSLIVDGPMPVTFENGVFVPKGTDDKRKVHTGLHVCRTRDEAVKAGRAMLHLDIERAEREVLWYRERLAAYGDEDGEVTA